MPFGATDPWVLKEPRDLDSADFSAFPFGFESTFKLYAQSNFQVG